MEAIVMTMVRLRWPWWGCPIAWPILHDSIYGRPRKLQSLNIGKSLLYIICIYISYIYIYIIWIYIYMLYYNILYIWTWSIFHSYILNYRKVVDWLWWSGLPWCSPCISPRSPGPLAVDLQDDSCVWEWEPFSWRNGNSWVIWGSLAIWNTLW